MNQNTLIALIRSLEMPLSFERSFRLSSSGISADRFLVSTANKKLHSDYQSECKAIFKEFGCPSSVSDVIDAGLAQASNLHWGIDRSTDNIVRKIYFEYPVGTDHHGASVSKPQLAFVGYKWNVADPTRVIQTLYRFRAFEDPETVLSEASQLCSGPVYSLTEELIRRAVARNAFNQIQYLQTTEATTQRHSFDINFYGSSLSLQECRSELQTVAESFSCPDVQFSSMLDQLSVHELGHLAAGKHRNGEDFLTIYYGAEHWKQNKTSIDQMEPESPGSSTKLDWLRTTEPGDGYFDYCLWPYKPRTPVQGKLKACNLLYHSFEVANLLPQASVMLDAIRRDFGDSKTVWGIKHHQNAIEWELYFYDYQRTERKVPAQLLLSTLSGNRPLPILVNESLPYFMFSVDIGADLILGSKEVEACDIYIGNPGSTVSSGISYLIDSDEMRMKNLYYFFDAQKDLESVIRKITTSVHFSETDHDIHELLRPELLDCRTICVSNKASCDTVYFSGINVHQLLFALVWLKFPNELLTFVERFVNELDHLSFDVGLDYTTKHGEIEILKTGYYANF